MQFFLSSLMLTLLAGAAAAQHPAQEPRRAYELKDGRLLRRALLPPPGLHPAADQGHQPSVKPAPGSYRSETYALRVLVPAPHPDSMAVISPAPRRAELPRQPLPVVKLLPEGRRRGQ